MGNPETRSPASRTSPTYDFRPHSPEDRDQGIRTDQRLHFPHPGGSGFLLGVPACVGLEVLAQCGSMIEARAERIRRGSAPNQEPLTSTGRPLDASWQFELGTSPKGFEPTPKNTADWAFHWILIKRTRYNTTTYWLTPLTTVTGLESGTVPGGTIFLWVSGMSPIRTNRSFSGPNHGVGPSPIRRILCPASGQPAPPSAWFSVPSTTSPAHFRSYPPMSKPACR